MRLFAVLSAVVRLCIMGSPPAASSSCPPNQYHDHRRLKCLDLCGSNNDIRCEIHEECGPVSTRTNTSRCVSLCADPCGAERYCDRVTGKCEPCRHICDARHRPYPDCRLHCYDIFERQKKPKTSQIPALIIITRVVVPTTESGVHHAGPLGVHWRWDSFIIPCAVMAMLTLLVCLAIRSRTKRAKASNDIPLTSMDNRASTPSICHTVETDLRTRNDVEPLTHSQHSIVVHASSIGTASTDMDDWKDKPGISSVLKADRSTCNHRQYTSLAPRPRFAVTCAPTTCQASRLSTGRQTFPCDIMDSDAGEPSECDDIGARRNMSTLLPQPPALSGGAWGRCRHCSGFDDINEVGGGIVEGVFDEETIRKYVLTPEQTTTLEERLRIIRILDRYRCAYKVYHIFRNGCLEVGVTTHVSVTEARRTFISGGVPESGLRVVHVIPDHILDRTKT